MLEMQARYQERMRGKIPIFNHEPWMLKMQMRKRVSQTLREAREEIVDLKAENDAKDAKIAESSHESR